MPSRADHVVKEARAARAEAVLVAEALPDWAMTALFYRAVHLVEAYLADQGIHSTSHSNRTRAVGRLLPHILEDYSKLLRLSRVARYDDLTLFSQTDYHAGREAFAAIEAVLARNR